MMCRKQLSWLSRRLRQCQIELATPIQRSRLTLRDNVSINFNYHVGRRDHRQRGQFQAKAHACASIRVAG